MSRVIVFVFDGLQKELVTEELMPNLKEFTSKGVRFLSHQPVFPTVTRVNSATMVTGCFPATHGLMGNTAIVPEFSKTEPMKTYLNLLIKEGIHCLFQHWLSQWLLSICNILP